MKQFYQRFLPYLDGNWLYLCYAMIGGMLVAAATAGIAQLIDPVLNYIFIQKNRELLYILPLLLVGVYALKSIGTYIQAYFIAYVGQRVIFKLRNDLLHKMLTFELGFFNQKRSGELLARVMYDTGQVQAALSNYCAEFVREVLTLIGLLGLLFFKNFELAFYGLIVLPAALLPLQLLARKMKKISTRTQEKSADVLSRLTEVFGNIEMLKANGSERLELERFEKENQHLLQLGMRSTRTSELTSPIMEVLGGIAGGIVIFIGGMQVIDGNMDTPEFVSFTAALLLLYQPVKRLSQLHNKFQMAVASGERIFELKNRVSTMHNGSQMIHHIDKLALESVHLRYGETEALKGVSFALQQGQSLALVGNSGGGKSSIVNLILRFYDPDSGVVRINDIDIKEFDMRALRQNIAVVTQKIAIFNESIAYNVAYSGLANGEEIDKERVIEALKAAHAWEFVSKLPQTIDTLLEESGTNLSGGQRQRIAIARVLYQNPSMLILDEATSALDNKTEASFKETLKEVMRDKITIIIAHRLSTIELADRIAFVQQGKIIAIGSYQELLQNCKEFAQLYYSTLQSPKDC